MGRGGESPSPGVPGPARAVNRGWLRTNSDSSSPLGNPGFRRLFSRLRIEPDPTGARCVLVVQSRAPGAWRDTGPALEGARISCGSRAAEGAIEAVVVNEDDIVVDVIGNSPPRSICGSGLIDAIAALLDLGIIDKTGRFADPDTLRDSLPPAIASRLCKQDGQPAFSLADGVVLTQKDIREVQLAKGAIRTGFKVLLKKFGLEDSDIEQVLLAGAFGNYIRPQSALRIGLLPDVPVERIHFVGNAASSGAQMILLSRQCRKRAKQLAHKIEYIEIANDPDFQTVFAESMLF